MNGLREKEERMVDLISRQAAIANYQHVCITVKCGDCPFRIEDGEFTDCRLERFLHQLPSAEPEQMIYTIKNDSMESSELDRLRDIISNTSDITIIPIPSEQHWIPVTERLPKAYEQNKDGVRRYYLVQNEYGDMMVCSWNGLDWEQMYQYKPIQEKVVAWMPLPESYKGGVE